jgi:hypothetical protein
MSSHKYFPVIKTRDAELRCFKHLSANILEQLLPIYELTKSRKTTKVPDGDIHRRMKQIEEIQKGRPFILDLSTNEQYINPQIEQLISEYDGFIDWQYFINLYKELNIIPMIHIYEDDLMVFPSVAKFVQEMSRVKSHMAVRLPYNLESEDINSYLTPIINNLNKGCTLYVLLDAEYIRNEASEDIGGVIDSFVGSCDTISAFGNKVEDIVMLCTTFPSNVAQTGGEDAEGNFKIYEEAIYQGIIAQHPNPIKYGDYVAINTEQIEMKGGTFVPRIDIALAHEFIYKRFRRAQGSYPRCATRMKDDKKYIDIGTWASQEIDLASRGNPTGISPSFWISVRMEYFINTRLNLRSSD